MSNLFFSYVQKIVMIHLVRLSRSAVLSSIFLVVSFLILATVPVCGEEITESVVGRYDDFEVDRAPTVGMGLFPTVYLEEKDEDAPAPKKTTTPFSSGSVWITISPFSGILNGQETYLIAGYLSGSRSGATLSVGKKGGEDSDFVTVETIKPDENGLFVWAVPADMSSNLFRVTASTTSGNAVSNGIRFVAESASDPVIKPVSSPVTPVSSLSSPASTPSSTPAATVVPMDSKASSTPGMTSLRISSPTSTPSVGDEVIISGRLTDSQGKGIGGATINLDETGYPGAQQAEPFSTTQTDSDGSFEFTITVSFANVVGLYAYFEGDDTYYRSDSNTLTFDTLN